MLAKTSALYRGGSSRMTPPPPRPHVGTTQSKVPWCVRQKRPLLCKYKNRKRHREAAGELELFCKGTRVEFSWSEA